MRVAVLHKAMASRTLATALVALGAIGDSAAQPIDVPPTWGGAFLTRPRLTGSWDGVRDEFGKKGVVFDVDLLATPQDVVSGGRDRGGNFWGNVDYTLNVDTDKAGLWPGGFLKVSADTGFGSNVYRKAGALIPVNTAALIPAPSDRTTALMNATFIQFLSPEFGLIAGKINTFDLSAQEFYGDYRTQFLNTAFFMPMTLEQVPITAYGAGLIALPREDIEFGVLALDPSGTPTSDSLGKAFDDGVTVVGGGKLTIKPWGLVGHQNLGFAWSDKERFALDQDPSNLNRLLLEEKFPRLANPGRVLSDILARFFPALPGPAQPANRSDTTWSMNYAFDQYLWRPEGDARHGIGVFFSFGASDGNPNPIHYAYVAGVGGKGVLPGRRDDSFGLAVSRTQFSGELLRFLRDRLDLGLHHEDALEIYYNAAITGWLTATADLQIVDPGLTKALSAPGSPTSGLTNVDTAVVAGLRLRARF